MSKELDNVFLDIRNAHRLLYRYQNRILNIVNYIREQTPFTDMWGSKWFSNSISTRRKSPDSEYANLSVSKDMWAWDFLYSYMFEYYFGLTEIGKRKVEMSIIQVSDDGFFISKANNSSQTDLSTYADSEDSHSYIVFNIGFGKWMKNEKSNDYWQFIQNFLLSENDSQVIKDDKNNKEFFIIKRYPMQDFACQQEADIVIRDFAKLVNDTVGLKIFKESFYQ